MKKKVINDKEKFYKKLFLYKTFLFKNTEFESSINDEELQGIIQALNIKKRGKRIEFIYDYCCDRVDDFYKNKNFCQFKNNQCICHQIPNCNYKNGCCRICRYQSNKGCTTKNLACKMFYCDQVKNNYETIGFRDLKILKLYTLRQRLMCFDNFFSHEKTFKRELKVGLLIPHSIGIVYRMFISSLYVRKHKLG